MKKGLSQEGLKLIACVSMLLDHIGAMLFPDQIWFRVIGRLAFPIFCFLLVEGMARTRDAGKYRNRLLLGVLLAELPFDLAVCGGISWGRCSVMVTLYLASWAIYWINKENGFGGLAAVLGLILAAEIVNCDYGALGVVTVLVLHRAKGQWLLIALWLGLLNWSGTQSGIDLLQIFTVASVLPMMCYDGRKLTRSKWIQWGFYLFYPVHLMLLYFVKSMV